MPANDKVLLQQQFNDFDQTYERIMIMEKNDVASIENIFFSPTVTLYLFVLPFDPLPAILHEIVNRKVRNNESYFYAGGSSYGSRKYQGDEDRCRGAKIAIVEKLG